VVRHQLTFDLAACTVDAVQRAVYRMSDRMSAEIVVSDSQIVCDVLFDETADVEAELGVLRNGVLDEVLRERIRDETREVRNLVLAVAFSKSGLVDSGEG
jgi:His-Xaa-Ser system protein HxsD